MQLQSYVGDWVLVKAVAARGFQPRREQEPRFYQSTTYQELPQVLLRIEPDGSYRDLPGGGARSGAAVLWRSPLGVDAAGPSAMWGRMVQDVLAAHMVAVPHGTRADTKGWVEHPEQALLVRELLCREKATLRRVLQSLTSTGLAQYVFLTYVPLDEVQDSLPDRLCLVLAALSGPTLGSWFQENEASLDGLADMVAAGCITDRQLDRLLRLCLRLKAESGLPSEATARRVEHLIGLLQRQLVSRGLTPERGSPDATAAAQGLADLAVAGSPARSVPGAVFIRAG